LVDDVLFLLLNDASNILGENLLYRKGDGVHYVVSVIQLDIALLEPVVADELALAIADFDTRKAIGLAAGELHDGLFVIVADVFAESRLLVEPWLLPLRAVCVSCVVGAFVPRFEDGHGVCVVLHDHESRVGVGAVEAVRVVLGLVRAPGIFGHDEGVVWLDVPVVQHPFDGNVEEAEGGVGVEEDDELVILDVVCERRGLDPGSVSVFEFVCVDKLVVVAVDEGVGVVVEDAAGYVVDVAPVVIAIPELLARLQRARLQIQNQDIAAHFLLVARVRWQLDVATVRFADEGLGRRCLQVLVEQPDDLADGHVCVAVRCGTELLLAVLSDATWDDGCRVAPSQLRPDGTNIRINMRLLAMRESHLRRSLPSHEAKDEDQHETSAHREREQWASPSYCRWHHHGCVYKERCKRATEGETVGVLLAIGEVQQAAQAGLGAQTLLNNPTREPSAPALGHSRRGHGAAEIALGRPCRCSKSGVWMRRPVANQTTARDKP
jgi:hypothetical protein